MSKANPMLNIVFGLFLAAVAGRMIYLILARPWAAKGQTMEAATGSMEHAKTTLVAALSLAAQQSREMSKLAQGGGDSVHYADRLALLNRQMTELNAGLEAIAAAEKNAGGTPVPRGEDAGGTPVPQDEDAGGTPVPREENDAG